MMDSAGKDTTRKVARPFAHTKSPPSARKTLGSLGKSGAAERRLRQGRIVRSASAVLGAACVVAMIGAQRRAASDVFLGGGGDGSAKRSRSTASGDWMTKSHLRESSPSSSSSSSVSISLNEADASKRLKRAAPVPAVADADEKAVGDSDVVEKAKRSGWEFFDGDLNEYYNKLHRDEKGKRNPKDVQTFAVHRWLGPKYSTVLHYEMLYDAIKTYAKTGGSGDMRVMDAGCGLGAGLSWFERTEPSWELVGYTVSEDQRNFVRDELPPHSFKVELRTYDEPLGMYDAIYSIEAFIHTSDAEKTLGAWAAALNPGGVIAIIDDLAAEGVGRNEEEVQLFAKSWLANSLYTVSELTDMGARLGLSLEQDRDVGAEYDVIGRNYGNKLPILKIDGKKTHQGWMGAKLRHKLTVEKKLTYRLLTFRKEGGGGGDGALVARKEEERKLSDDTCEAVPSVASGGKALEVKTVEAQLRTGVGKNGGEAMKCISGWYCCNKGAEWWDDLEKTRTDKTKFLHLPRELFGHYLDVMVKHLNEFYATLPADFAGGKFLDIGGTGSTASGMAQVTSKFAHWSGPLEYWVLDSDPAAKGLPRCVSCDVADCPSAKTCGYDVTFSHTVLEHSSRPWKAFDEIARMTKKGGLTMHLVPFSYQYHATPDDHFRFSHAALKSLLEDRGFSVLEVGYDICTQPDDVKRKRKDEHFEVIWLTYVVGKKN